MNFLLKSSFFRGHVNFLGGSIFVPKSRHIFSAGDTILSKPQDRGTAMPAGRLRMPEPTKFLASATNVRRPQRLIRLGKNLKNRSPVSAPKIDSSLKIEVPKSTQKSSQKNSKSSSFLGCQFLLRSCKLPHLNKQPATYTFEQP